MTNITMADINRWEYNSREPHRKAYNDVEWANAQPKGPPKYMIGDVVEFHAGGFGVIDKVSPFHSGCPSQYATTHIEGLPRYNKGAWHYEGDFKRWVAQSPLHDLGFHEINP
jgi:hypothetical protein